MSEYRYRHEFDGFRFDIVERTSERGGDRVSTVVHHIPCVRICAWGHDHGRALTRGDVWVCEDCGTPNVESEAERLHRLSSEGNDSR